MVKKQKKSSDIFIPHNAAIIYTDGSYRPEGNAAFAYLIYNAKSKEVTHLNRCAKRGATINQMELLSISRALDYAYSDYVIIYSDSLYAINCLVNWHKTWAKHDWKTPSGEEVKNKEIIQEILSKIAKKKYVRFNKVEAHSGDPFNSIVDYLARDLTSKMRQHPDLADGDYPC